jgi:hypothetical protein
MQRGPPILVLGCHIRTMLEKEVCDFCMSLGRRLMQWCPPAHVLGDHVRAMLEKDAYYFHEWL